MINDYFINDENYHSEVIQTQLCVVDFFRRLLGISADKTSRQNMVQQHRYYVLIYNPLTPLHRLVTIEDHKIGLIFVSLFGMN